MKLFLLTLSTLIWTLSLHSESCYSIRILSMNSDSSAKKASQILQDKYEKNKLFASLQKEYNLSFTREKKGNYYVVELNCFTNQIILQEVIDIVRIDYKDAFVRKGESSSCTKNLKIQTNEKIKIIYKEVIKEVEIIKEIEVMKEVKIVQHSKLFLLLFIISVLALVSVSYLLYISKQKLLKSNKLLEEKDSNDEFGLDDIDFDDMDFDVDEDFLENIDDIK